MCVCMCLHVCVLNGEGNLEEEMMMKNEVGFRGKLLYVTFLISYISFLNLRFIFILDFLLSIKINYNNSDLHVLFCYPDIKSL